MNWLNKHKGINIITTHDIELIELNKHTHANYNFTETIHDKNIKFDYKLKKGPITTRNAINLLKLFNYP